MAGAPGKTPPVSSPLEAVKGAGGSLLLVMEGLRDQPASGRLLRGLTPYLDEQGAEHVVLLTERRRREPWSDSEQVVRYQEVVHWARDAGGGTYRGTVWKDQPLTREEAQQAFELDPLGVVDWAARRAQAAVVSSREPIALAPCIVPKPWGRELWYTGIEKRGRATVRSSTGETELPYALGMFPVPTLGESERPPVLLKALEPLPQPVLGDLYLEVHRQKWEVYVVLDVDRGAWPDGVGGLRAGIAPEAIARTRAGAGADWQAALTRDLRGALQAYEGVRRRIDGLLDEALAAAGLDPALGVPPARREALLARVPAALHAEEAAKRAAVEAFLGRVPMAEGAVACLRPGVLHSLQHGVKVIEFQTPTYERLIAMFAQKVLTQSHWDIDAALAKTELAAFSQPPLAVLEQGQGVTLEQVVHFPDFEVRRLTVTPAAPYAGATAGGAAYQVWIGVSGSGQIVLPGGQAYDLRKEAAYLLPASLGAFQVRAQGENPLCVLITLPAQPAAPEAA